MKVTMKISIPDHLSDAALVARMSSRADREREAAAQVNALLAEVDARRLYLAAGVPSLLRYCTEVLGLPEDEAYSRIEEIRAARPSTTSE